MRYLTIKIANCVIDIRTHFHRAYRICKPFSTDEKASISIQCSFDDFAVLEAEYEKIYHQPAPSDVFLEVPTLLLKTSEALLEYDTILMHGAVIALDNASYMFIAPSGTGKTSHILKWLEHLPDAFIVNGDKPFILTYEDGRSPMACGSPWAGKEDQYTNTMVPLKSIILMERAEGNSIERISFAEAFPTLLKQTYRPEDPDKMRKTLKLIQRLNPAVSFWRFKFNNMKDDCFDVAYNALVGQDQ